MRRSKASSVCARQTDWQARVIIPAANQRNLVLHDDVLKAVEAGEFHIYCVRHVDEAIHLLLDREPGTADAEGNFPEGSVNGEIIKRLEAIARMTDPSRKDGESPEDDASVK